MLTNQHRQGRQLIELQALELLRSRIAARRDMAAAFINSLSDLHQQLERWLNITHPLIPALGRHLDRIVDDKPKQIWFESSVYTANDLTWIRGNAPYLRQALVDWGNYAQTEALIEARIQEIRQCGS